ncbi:MULTISPECIES: ATP synthase F1 subunit delta [unclassified Carboxylicivirga]|uniref:ATP synthase F1 subunit delta n=1 Tax=Carboxylicivirga TaxID=1628153 RepID=UPI003D32C025
MNRSLIANRYAKALFMLAQEQQVLDDVYQDMKLLLNYCKEAEGFIELLYSPVIKPGQKRKAFHSVLDGAISINSRNLVDLLITNKREVLLEDISRQVVELYKSDKGIKTVTVFTAIALNDSQFQALKQFLHDHLRASIELTIKVKPELLGGFILMVDGKMADASMSSKLKKIKRQLLS